MSREGPTGCASVTCITTLPQAQLTHLMAAGRKALNTGTSERWAAACCARCWLLSRELVLEGAAARAVGECGKHKPGIKAGSFLKVSGASRGLCELTRHSRGAQLLAGRLAVLCRSS